MSRNQVRRFHRGRDPWDNDNLHAACSFGAVAIAAREDLVEQVKRITHDRVVAHTGMRRVSGVRWTLIPAQDIDRCRFALTAGEIDPGVETTTVDEYLTYLAEHPVGALIIASAKVRQPATRVGLS